MSTLTSEQFQEICQNIFGFECFDFARNTFHAVDPYTKEPVSDEDKYLFSLLQEIANTEVGSKILSELDPQEEIDLIWDPAEKENCSGYNTGNVVALTDISTQKEDNVLTALHELIHVVQKQQKGDSLLCAAAQDRFMVNKMMEAETRLTEALFAYEKITVQQAQIDYCLALKQDIATYKKLKDAGYPHQVCCAKFLAEVYQDQAWNKIYNPQGLDESNYRVSPNYTLSQQQYIHTHRLNMDTIIKGYANRLGLDTAQIAYLLNPQNISLYPTDQIKPKKEINMPADAAQMQQGIFSVEQIREDDSPTPLQEIHRDKEGKILTQIDYLDGQKFTEQNFDKQGRLYAQTNYLADGRLSKKYFDEQGKVAANVSGDEKSQFIQFYQNEKFLGKIFITNNKITGIYGADNKSLMSGDQANQQKQLYATMAQKLGSQADVTVQELIVVAAAVTADKLRSYLLEPQLYQNLRRAFREKLKQDKENGQIFSSEEEKSKFRQLGSALKAEQSAAATNPVKAENLGLQIAQLRRKLSGAGAVSQTQSATAALSDITAKMQDNTRF